MVINHDTKLLYSNIIQPSVSSAGELCVHVCQVGESLQPSQWWWLPYLAIPLALQRGVGYGEIMFSLSYLPTAERLTVVVVKARSLQWTGDKTNADPFVKVKLIDIFYLAIDRHIFLCEC